MALPDCNYPMKLKPLVKKHVFKFLDETCITVTKEKQTEKISQTWSNEIGSSNQCNCICFKSFMFVSYTPFILSGISVIVTVYTIINISVRFFKSE